MSSKAATLQGFPGLDGLCRAETWGLDVAKLMERPFRLEAGFYGSDGYAAMEAMTRSGFEMTTVGDLARVLWFGPFPRRYVDDPEHGLPFLSSSHMMEARPRDYPLISFKHTPDLERYIVREGQILVSCSGTIGNVALVTKDLDGWAVSQHAIRVIPRDPLNVGVLFCFLQSALGQFLIKRRTSGSVVSSIYQADIADLPIPSFPLGLRKRLSDLILDASRLRVDANALLDRSQVMLVKQAGLPSFATFGRSESLSIDHQATLFALPAAANLSAQKRFGMRRLDVTYHDPAIAKLKAFLHSRGGVRFGDLVQEIRSSALRKRAYVEGAENGVPLLGGKQLMQTRPVPVGFLSRFLTKGLARERVSKGWLLLSSGGTIGRLALVDRHQDRSIFTQDVLRLICNASKTFAGFLYAFLASPYGNTQLIAASYGSVQKKLRDFQVANVLVPLPDDRGESIHQVVDDAFEKRADAIDFENQAVLLFIDAIKQGRQATDAQWGQ